MKITQQLDPLLGSIDYSDLAAFAPGDEQAETVGAEIEDGKSFIGVHCHDHTCYQPARFMNRRDRRRRLLVHAPPPAGRIPEHSC